VTAKVLRRTHMRSARGAVSAQLSAGKVLSTRLDIAGWKCNIIRSLRASRKGDGLPPARRGIVCRRRWIGVSLLSMPVRHPPPPGPVLSRRRSGALSLQVGAYRRRGAGTGEPFCHRHMLA
jgi:hypothetical protein